jgi:hypothetical protein
VLERGTFNCAAAVGPEEYASRVDPRTVGADEQLPEPVYARSLLCRVCRRALLYQRQERPRFPCHFFWCARCGRRFAAWDAWSPGLGMTDPKVSSCAARP